MKVTILFSSLRKNSNTQLLLNPFINQLIDRGVEVDKITLRNLKIEPCTACWRCQDVFDDIGCLKKDDMNVVFSSVLSSDVIIFATPIYSWYCTPPLKSAMDRMVYGMNKYYGKEKGPCLWEDKKLAIVTTCGYSIPDGAGVFEEGVKRYAKHSNLDYLGMMAVQDTDGKEKFTSDKIMLKAKNFANYIIESL